MPIPLPPAISQALTELGRIAAGKPLWPGFRPAETPLVLHGGNAAYLIGHPAPPAGFEPLEPMAGRTVHVGPLPTEVTGNTAMPIGGLMCALALLPGEHDDPVSYARLLLHECFHVFQQQVLKSVALPDFTQISRYPENDATNNAMAVVENRLLIEALASDAEADARSGAGRFTSVRLARHARLAPVLRTYEAAEEYNEGTPTYIEFRAGRPESDLPPQLAQCNIGGKWAAYRRFYFTGAAIALLLDRLSSGWQSGFAAGDATLQDLLRAAAGPLPPAGQVLAEAGYPEILAAEQEREADRRRRIAELLERLETGPGCRVEIDATQAPYCGWDPTNCLVVEPGIRLHTRYFCLLDGGAIKVEIEGLTLEDRVTNVITTRLAEAPLVTAAEPFRMEGPDLRGEAPRGRLEPMAGGCRIRLQGKG